MAQQRPSLALSGKEILGYRQLKFFSTWWIYHPIKLETKASKLGDGFITLNGFDLINQIESDKKKVPPFVDLELASFTTGPIRAPSRHQYDTI